MNTFFRQLLGELQKLIFRNRTYIGFGAFLGAEIIILALLRLPRVQRGFAKLLTGAGYSPEEYLSGLTLGLTITLSTVLLLGALFLALVAGDVVSKEVEDGTLRMMLCRPVTRGRILVLKYVTCAIYTLALTFFIALTALATGYVYAGRGGLFLYAPLEEIFAVYAEGPGLVRYFLAIPFLSLSLLTISSIGFFFSCLRMKPAAATTVTLSILFVDMVLKNTPFFGAIREWFLTARMSTWVVAFEYRIPWEILLENYAWLIALDVTLFTLAWAVFSTRDFKA